MKIGIDGGALCGICNQRYGTYNFTYNFLKALSVYDKNNEYIVYTYCDIDKNLTFDNVKYKKVLPKRGWMKFSLSLENLFNTKQNAFLGINQALPMFNRGKKIVISRGLSFYLYPQYYKEDYKRLKKQLDQYIKIADHIVVSSERVKNELEQINNKIIDKVIILPFGIPFHLKYTDNRHIKKKKYFLYVGSDQKIKNLDFTINVFKKLKKINQFKDYKLVLIGVKDKNLASEGIECIPHLFGKKLIKYYQEATAYISSSYYESFNQPVIEALSQSCPVVALEQSIIPEQKPFVHNVKNQEEMIAEIKSLAIHNRNKIDYNKFEQTFSWKKFVKKLKLLYN